VPVCGAAMKKEHGYSGYVRGCRCEVCRTAKAEYARAWRAKAKGASPAAPVKKPAPTVRVRQPVIDLARLELLAQTLMLRVRDEGPEDNAEWWDTLSPREQRAVAFILASAVPDDRPWSDLIAWTDPEGAVERRRQQWREALQRRAARGGAVSGVDPKLSQAGAV
jgi:hypothetical protein